MSTESVTDRRQLVVLISKNKNAGDLYALNKSQKIIVKYEICILNFNVTFF